MRTVAECGEAFRQVGSRHTPEWGLPVHPQAMFEIRVEALEGREHVIAYASGHTSEQYFDFLEDESGPGCAQRPELNPYEWQGHTIQPEQTALVIFTRALDKITGFMRISKDPGPVFGRALLAGGVVDIAPNADGRDLELSRLAEEALAGRQWPREKLLANEPRLSPPFEYLFRKAS